MIYTPFVWLQLVAALLMAGLALYARRFRGVPAAKPFVVLMGLATFWALEYGLDISATSLSHKLFLLNLRVIPIALIPGAALWLALEYTGQDAWLTRRRLALLLVVPVLVILLAWTNSYHSLYRYNLRLNLDAPFPLLIWERGPIYWVAELYAGTVSAAAILVLIRSFRTRGLYAGNTLILIAGILIPMATDVLFNVGVTPWQGYNPASSVLVVSGAFFAWALLRFGLFGVAPVARSAAMDAIDDLVIAVDIDNHVVDFNRAAQAVCGCLARSNGAAPHTLPPACADLLQRYPGLTTGKEQVALDWGQGPHIYDLTVSVVHDARRQALGRLFVLHDVTARKKAEEIIRLRLRLLEFAADHPLPELMQQALDEIGQLTNSPIGFYHFVEEDQKTLTLQAWSTRTKQEFCRAEGQGLHYDLDKAGVWVDCVGQRGPVIHNDYASLPHRKGMPPGHAEVKRELVVPTLRAGRVVSVLGVGNKPTGYDEKDIELIAYVADIVWTIVERKWAETALRESEERHRTMFETIVQGIVYQDAQGRIISANPAAKEILGLTLDQMQGRTSVDPRWKPIHEDGSDFPGETHPAMVALRTGQEVRDVVMGVFNPRHDAYAWLSVNAIPLFKEGIDTPWQVYTTFEDITARRQAQEDLSQYAGQLATQNAELDAFAHTVAHDLKNPLATIIGFAEVLAEDLVILPQQDVSKAVANILRIGQKLDRSIDELMLLAGIRKQEITPEPLDMGAVIEDALEGLQLLIQARHAQVEVLDGADWPVTLGYAPWIEQVWDNYISNAIKYGGRPPLVQIGADFVGPANLSGVAMARFWVQDNGPGLSTEAQASLFTPFTRLDQARIQGHGLGLSIVRRIVEKLGGQVGVESRPGQGSRFFFTLPLGKNTAGE